MKAAAGEASAPDINTHRKYLREYEVHGGRDGDGTERGSAMVLVVCKALLT